MPYVKITYTAPDPVWVKVSDGDAADPECWPEIFDVINSNADVEIEYPEAAVDELPDGVAKPDWDIT